MYINYEIPKHLQPFLSDFDEQALQKLITLMLELAVRHDMLHFPDTFLERSVKEIRDNLRDIKTTSSLSLSNHESMLREIIVMLQNMKYNSSSFHHPITLDVETITFNATGDKVDEEMEEGDWDDFLDSI